MTAFRNFDIRTVIACQILMGLVFGFVIGGMHFAYRHLRGLGLISLGFLTAVPGALLILLRGHVPYFASVVVGNLLIHVWYLLLYWGTIGFLSKGKMRLRGRLVLLSCAIALDGAALAYYSLVDDRIVARVVVVSVVLTLQFGLFSFDILKLAEGLMRLRLFGIFLAIFTVLNFSRVFLTPILGCNPDLLQDRGIQMFSVLAGVIFTTGLGIFFLANVAGELRLAIEQGALQDRLTETLNRAGIEARLEAELARSRRNDRVFCAALIDIDYFKSINDTGGHAAGDKALRTICRAITAGLRSYDQLGRYGGDEFLLLLPETTPVEAAVVMDRIRRQVSSCDATRIAPALEADGFATKITVSIGFSAFSRGDSAATLLHRADAALYDAKRAGRNCTRERSVESAVGWEQGSGSIFEQDDMGLSGDVPSLTA